MPSSSERFPPDKAPDQIITTEDLESSIDHYSGAPGFRLVSIFPADSPRVAELEKDGYRLRLEIPSRSDQNKPAGLGGDVTSGEAGSRTSYPEDGSWQEGRAGMLYRDLIPGRLGGRIIASHIRIPEGGPVPDYVHFHKIRFQVICCLRGWATLVYEDQGPPFRFEAGDCVLQPPGIRHRVLESSDGFEVIEISSPAEHTTYAEHSIRLPNETVYTGRDFEGQRFRHFSSRGSTSEVSAHDTVKIRETLINEASAGNVDVRLLEFGKAGNPSISLTELQPFILFAVEGDGLVVETEGSEGLLPAGQCRLAISAGSVSVRSSSIVNALLIRFTKDIFANDPKSG